MRTLEVRQAQHTEMLTLAMNLPTRAGASPVTLFFILGDDVNPIRTSRTNLKSVRPQGVVGQPIVFLP